MKEQSHEIQKPRGSPNLLVGMPKRESKVYSRVSREVEVLRHNTGRTGKAKALGLVAPGM